MSQPFGDVQIFTGKEQGNKEVALNTNLPSQSGGVSVEQSRAVAETQSAMVVARMNPRNEEASYLKIIKACKRTTLADQSQYAYKRGGKLISDASIRLAEVIAQNWGNMTYGFRELNRFGDMSEVEAFAWDLETNTRVTRAFFVKHFRDKQGGGQALTAERDKYEHIASQAQRRVRACIFEIVPGDIIEAAKNQCNKTIKDGDGRPLEDRIKDMIVAFDEIGVSQTMIEDMLQHQVKAIVTPELTKLTQIYRSINDGVATREEFFKLDTPKPKAESKKKDEDKKKEGPKSNGGKEDDKKLVEANKKFEEIKEKDPESFDMARVSAGIKGTRITDIEAFDKFMVCYDEIKGQKVK